LIPAPTGLAADLARLEDEGRPIRIGIIGCGEMGTDLVTQIAGMRGLRVVAIVDRRGESALAALALAGHPAGTGAAVDGLLALDRAIEQGRIGIVEDAKLMLRSGLIEVVIDATGRPEAGAELGLATLEAGKHLVMMNVEADVTIGPWLKRAADRAGLVYTIGAGDEPTAVMELIEFATALGYPIVAAGKGKNNPLNIDAVPADYAEEAMRRNMNPRMLVEFVDGSKTMVEMAVIANATGLTLDVPGMHGPKATLADLHEILCPRAHGGILGRSGVVDYTTGTGVAPGVFVITEIRHPRLRERMHDLKLGEGPYYTFYRPHHLTSLEVPLSAARAVLYRKADLVPLPEPVVEVAARAKRDLRPGDRLDAIGETCYRSFALNMADALAEGVWPVGLLDGGTVLRPIAKGDLLRRSAVAVRTDTTLYALRMASEAERRARSSGSA